MVSSGSAIELRSAVLTDRTADQKLLWRAVDFSGLFQVAGRSQTSKPATALTLSGDERNVELSVDDADLFQPFLDMTKAVLGEEIALVTRRIEALTRSLNFQTTLLQILPTQKM